MHVQYAILLCEFVLYPLYMQHCTCMYSKREWSSCVSAELWLINATLLSTAQSRLSQWTYTAAVVSPDPSPVQPKQTSNRSGAVLPPQQAVTSRAFWGVGSLGSCAISALLTLDKSGQNMAGQDGCAGGWVGLRGRHRSLRGKYFQWQFTIEVASLEPC